MNRSLSRPTYSFPRVRSSVSRLDLPGDPLHQGMKNARVSDVYSATENTRINCATVKHITSLQRCSTMNGSRFANWRFARWILNVSGNFWIIIEINFGI